MIDAIASFLFSAACVLAAAMLTVLALRRAMHRFAGAEVAHTAWLLVPLSLLVLALPQPPADDPAWQAFSLIALPAAPGLRAAAAGGSGVPMAPDAAAADPGSRVSSVSLLVPWALGTLALGGWMWRRHRRYLGGLLPRPDGWPWRIGAGGQPGVFGALRPRLVLPLDFKSRFEVDDRRLILAHERVHARRCDPLWNLLAAALLAAQWFNPLAWWAHAVFRRDQEISCDAAVLRRRPRQASRYARLLARDAQSAAGSPVASHWPGRHPAVERVAMLRGHLLGRAVWRLPVLVAVAAGAFGAAHAARPVDAPGGVVEAPAGAPFPMPLRVEAGVPVRPLRAELVGRGDAPATPLDPAPTWGVSARVSPAGRPAVTPAVADGPVRMTSAASSRPVGTDVSADRGASFAIDMPARVSAGRDDPGGGPRLGAAAALPAASPDAIEANGAAPGAGESPGAAVAVPARVIKIGRWPSGTGSLPPWPGDAAPVNVALTLSIDARGRLVGERIERSPAEPYARVALRAVRSALYGAARTATGERIASELPVLVTIAPPRCSFTPNTWLTCGGGRVTLAPVSPVPASERDSANSMRVGSGTAGRH